MDLAKYQQSLINIRSKYSQERFGTSKQAEITFSAAGDSESQYQTPQKVQKQGQRAGATWRKGRILDIQIALSQREQQITERVERNKELLSRSKQLRESQGKRNQAISPCRSNSTIKRNAAIPCEKENRVKKGEIEYLKFLLKEKQLISESQNTEGDRLILQKKSNFTDHFGDHRFSFGAETPTKDKEPKIQIKTPILPPKQIEICVPIDSNLQTKRIQQRIQMILSK